MKNAAVMQTKNSQETAANQKTGLQFEEQRQQLMSKSFKTQPAIVNNVLLNSCFTTQFFISFIFLEGSAL